MLLSFQYSGLGIHLVEGLFLSQLRFGYAIQFFRIKSRLALKAFRSCRAKLVNGTKNVLFYNTMQFRISKNKEPDCYCHGNDKRSLEIEYFVVNDAYLKIFEYLSPCYIKISSNSGFCYCVHNFLQNLKNSIHWELRICKCNLPGCCYYNKQKIEIIDKISAFLQQF